MTNGCTNVIEIIILQGTRNHGTHQTGKPEHHRLKFVPAGMGYGFSFPGG